MFIFGCLCTGIAAALFLWINCKDPDGANFFICIPIYALYATGLLCAFIR